MGIPQSENVGYVIMMVNVEMKIFLIVGITSSEKGVRKMIKIFSLLLMIGCGGGDIIYSEEKTQKDISLNLYMNYPLEDGFYRIDYPNNRPHHYTSVEYQTESLTRIYWTSIDSFTIYHFGYPITEPIINYSTYSRDDGSGKQMIYLYQDFINDTLMIRGCITESNCEELEFIIY